MATKEAVAQLAVLPERVSVLETQVENINEKLIDLKADVKEMHDCLDQTRDMLSAKLEKMQEEYRANASRYFEHADRLHAEDVATHEKMGSRIGALERVKNKWQQYVMVLLAFGAGTGWLSGHSINAPQLLKFIGL
jgi:predicted RNase H-like nuclease (RuvC/YqgF family)